jgi:prevent-host-death family protein
MFKTLPELVPISDLRTRQGEILAGLERGPVILTQHSKAAAVLVSTDQYNRMIEMLEDLQDALDAKEARRNAEPVIDFEEYLAKRGVSVSAVSEQSGDEGS